MYANVLVQYGVKSLDHTFTYRIPDNLIGIVSVGVKVNVPFGKQNINGFVLSISNEVPLTEVKDIKDVVTKELKLNEEMLDLGKHIKELTQKQCLQTNIRLSSKLSLSVIRLIPNNVIIIFDILY